jgi:hypothetical protein
MKPIYAKLVQNLRINRCEECLAVSRPGRVTLHVLSLLRHPGHSRWHWLGIIREFAH